MAVFLSLKSLISALNHPLQRFGDRLGFVTNDACKFVVCLSPTIIVHYIVYTVQYRLNFQEFSAQPGFPQDLHEF